MTAPVTLTPAVTAPAMGPIETSLQGVDREERRRRLAAHHVMNVGVGRAFTRTGVIIVYEQPYLSDDGKVLWVWLDAFDASGVRLIGADDRDFGFVNPPVTVPDGTFSSVVDPISGGKRLVSNKTENVLAAFEEMVFDRVVVRARELGWPG
jgi:hypothetical protein